MNNHYGAAIKTKPIEDNGSCHLKRQHPPFYQLLLLFFGGKIILTYTTERANPIFGKVFKGCSGSYSIIRIAYFRVIYITTCLTNVLFHNLVF